jgi:hypothetical protein
MGNCVTGDTLLPIRRRKKKKNPDLNGNGDPNCFDIRDSDFEFEYLYCRIDEVQPGDEVLSLSLSEEQNNLGSGTLEYARINKLMDMGYQEVYELETKSGRKIRTTGNHPYLVELNYNHDKH